MYLNNDPASLLVILAFAGSIALSVSLILAPLYIWKWTKATNNEVKRLNDTISGLLKELQAAKLAPQPSSEVPDSAHSD